MSLLSDTYISRDDAVRYDTAPDEFADRAQYKGFTLLELLKIAITIKGNQPLRRKPRAALITWGVVLAGFLFDSIPAQAEFFTNTGAMTVGRANHTATLLPNGKVLVAAGNTSSGALSSAELYDPSTGVWRATGALGASRNTHTATLLSNGKVLVAGGYNSGAVSGAELYDPSTGAWTATGAPNINRIAATATLLANGKLLVAGGETTSGVLSSAELYDPNTGTWAWTGSMPAPRWRNTQTLLSNGKVLVTGGAADGAQTVILSSAALYDPETGRGPRRAR